MLPDPDRQPDFYDSVPAKRLFAWFIDTVLIVLLCLVAVLLTAFIGAFFWPVLYLVIGFAYRTLTIAAGSATWGMRFMGIELRDAEGARLDGVQALLHTAGYTASVALAPLQLISILLMAFSPRGQGLTDMVMGTAMLNRRAVYV
jgi:uncharacterized RDD family membrane protein YckC